MEDLLVLEDRAPPKFPREQFPTVKETRRSRMARGLKQKIEKNLLILKDKTPFKFLRVKVSTVKETRKSCMARGGESLPR